MMMRAARLACLSRALRPHGLWRPRGLASATKGFERAESLYKRLDVEPGAPLAEIKLAYYRKAKDCHPDLHGQDTEMSEKFRKLTDAYEVLSDPETREQYDKSGIEDIPGQDPTRSWRPGDGPRAEEMEGQRTAWKAVLRDRAVLKQAREEYVEDLTADLTEAIEGLARGDASAPLDFARRRPGITLGGLLSVVPVALLLRSPQAALAVTRLGTVALTTVWVSSWGVFLTSMVLDIPGLIWKARVRSARRAIQRRAEQRREEATGATSEAAAAADAGATGGGGVAADATGPAARDAATDGLSVSTALHAASGEDLPEATSQVSNLVYLDDSASMVCFKVVPEGAFSLSKKYRWDKTCLEAGHKELRELAHYLEGTPLRVVKFGGVTEYDEVWSGHQVQWVKEERMLRELLLESASFDRHRELRPLLESWDGTSQGTYMWKMMETDIMETCVPGSSIRVHLITDGVDTHSPGEFRGIQGMEALKASLRDKGYRIEWNIILLLFGSHEFHGLAARRYAELCDSSGGVFKMVSDGYGNSGADEDMKLFLAAFSTDGARQRYRDHMLAARTSGDEGFKLPQLT